MNAIPMSVERQRELHPGEALTMATVTLVFTVVILAIVAYKLFVAGKAKVQVPGGWKFEWSAIYR